MAKLSQAHFAALQLKALASRRPPPSVRAAARNTRTRPGDTVQVPAVTKAVRPVNNTKKAFPVTFPPAGPADARVTLSKKAPVAGMIHFPSNLFVDVSEC